MSFVEIPRRILRTVEKPARYLGGEWNSARKEDLDQNGKERIHFAFCFPDSYEVGMSNLALRILYALLNREEDLFCERVFMPAGDMLKEMEAHNIPLFSVETGRSLEAFDLIGFTLQYEMSYPTVLAMLAQGKVPLFQKDRGEQDPFVVAGGPVVFNAEPVADFFDLMMIGEGEEVLPELIEVYRRWRESGAKREEFLRLASELEGVYVPSYYEPEYGKDGRFLALRPQRPGLPQRIRKRVIRDLNRCFVPVDVMVPNLEIVHDRVFLELYRGCANGCRFCQAGMIYRPVRERSSDTLFAQAETMIKTSGYEEIGLLSLSSGDYSELTGLIDRLLPYCEENHINFSLPSLRLDSVSMELLDKISRTRKAGLTFAPEAGSQNMRDRINKNILEQDLLDAAAMAFELGWDRLKLYFMLGLPDETDEDILGIADLCRKLLALRQELTKGTKRRKVMITVSTSFFIPKPWTPFQWEAQISREEMERRQLLLANALRDSRISYQWHDFDTSEIEALLARGDRRLSAVLYDVWLHGGRMESERHGFSYQRWMDALRRCGIDMDFYVSRERARDEIFPWDMIDPGVKKDFLLREKERAAMTVTTADCRSGCQACGALCFQAGICPGADRED